MRDMVASIQCSVFFVADEGVDNESSDSSSSDGNDTSDAQVIQRGRRPSLWDMQSEWFPWPDKIVSAALRTPIMSSIIILPLELYN